MGCVPHRKDARRPELATGAGKSAIGKILAPFSWIHNPGAGWRRHLPALLSGTLLPGDFALCATAQ